MAQDHRTGPLKKSDMTKQYRYPTGPSEGDNPHIRGVPDSSLLNKHEWYEMLYFCNKFANEHGNGAVSVASKAEKLIHEHLPDNLRSHAHVTGWLLNNWQAYN